MSGISATFVAVVTGVIGLAIVSVLVAQKAQTPGVLQAGGTAFAQIISAAEGNNFGSGGTAVGGVTQ